MTTESRPQTDPPNKCLTLRRAVAQAIDDTDRALEAIDRSHQAAADRLTSVLMQLAGAREAFDAATRVAIQDQAERDAALYQKHGETQDPGAFAVEGFKGWIDDLDDPADALGALDNDAARSVYVAAFLKALAGRAS